MSSSRFVNQGRAGALTVLEMAFEYLSFDGNHFVVVGGVDSFHDFQVMQYFYDRYRVLRPGAFEGIIPGEGAGFLLLVSPNAPEDIRQNLSRRVSRPATSFEQGHLMGEGTYTAEALSQSFDGVLNSLRTPIEFIYSSENGEMHYAKELSIALMRNQDRLGAGVQVQRPAEFLGDTGAAHGAIALALTSKQLSASKSAVVYCSSDSGTRAAVLVEAAAV